MTQNSVKKSRQKSNRVSVIWVCFVVWSLAFEKPLLELMSYDRLNPRLFDFVVLVGLLLVAPKLVCQNFLSNKVVKIWTCLVCWFVFCSIASCLFLLPLGEGAFSLFYAARYVIGLFPVLVVGVLKVTSGELRKIHAAVVGGGVFVALYCIPEYLGGGTQVVELAGRKEAIQAKGTITGPFGVSYFHLAQHAALSFVLTLGYAMGCKRLWVRVLWVFGAVFVSWPLFFCGSRTGIALAAGSLLIALSMIPRLRGLFFICLPLIAVVNIIFDRNIFYDSVKEGKTVERLVSREYGESENSILDRVSKVVEFPFNSYVHSSAQPLIGGGFYVVPMQTVEGGVKYRRGYGYHNIYWFVYEQAGIFGVGLFVWFVFATITGLNRVRRQRNVTIQSKAFVISVFAFWVTSLIVGLGGHNFWRGFASGNFNTLVLILIVLGVRVAGQPGRHIRVRSRVVSRK